MGLRRTGTDSVVRILTTDPSVCSTTCVKSGTDSVGATLDWAWTAVPATGKAMATLAAAQAAIRFIGVLPRRINCIMELLAGKFKLLGLGQGDVLGALCDALQGFRRNFSQGCQPVITHARTENVHCAGVDDRVDVLAFLILLERLYEDGNCGEPVSDDQLADRAALHVALHLRDGLEPLWKRDAPAVFREID